MYCLALVQQVQVMIIWNKYNISEQEKYFLLK